MQSPIDIIRQPEKPQKHAVTISRESGCGARVVADLLARHLQLQSFPGAPVWTVFDRNLVETVLADHHLPARLARYMPEDRVHEIRNFTDELFGLHPPSWTLFRQISDTVLKLVNLGNVIILGRGANVITADVPHVVHVRMIGSLEKRIERLREMDGLDKTEAKRQIHQEDSGRRRYFRHHFHLDVDDPALYDLVVNTDHVTPQLAAEMISRLVYQNVPAAA